MASSVRTLFVFCTFFSVAMAALPGGLKACKVSANDFNNCLSNEVTKALKFFKDGNKKMGVNAIDPFKFQRLLIDQGTGPVAIKLEFRNLELNGLSTLKVAETKNDWKTMVHKLHQDQLSLIGDYSISGKVMVLPIAGSGKSNITMESIDIETNMKLKEVTKGGKTYFQATSFEIFINPKKTYFYLENLFNGDKALGDNMNLFLNENHQEIINELKPAISKAFSQGFLQVANQVFSKIPVNEIKIK